MRPLAAMLEDLQGLVDDDQAAAREADARRHAETVAQAARADRLRRAGAGLRPQEREGIVNATLDLERTKAIRAVVRWRTARVDDWPTLVLKGPRGTGKSVAAIWYLAQTGGHIRSPTSVARVWISTTNRAADEQLELCQSATLLIDDVGTELPHQVAAVGAALRELLEARQSLRTILTTNLTREAFEARYPDERLISRMERAAWVDVDGPDLRSRR